MSVLDEYAQEWRLVLRSAQRTPATIRTYLAGVRLLGEWLDDQYPEVKSADEVTPAHIRAWLGTLTERGAASRTVASRYAATRSFFAWLEAEGEIDASPVVRVTRPRLDETRTRVPTVADLRAVLATAGDRRDFRDVRDSAILRLMFDCGLRLTEAASLRLSDLDVAAGEVSVMGKGRKPRTTAYGATTAAALARYLRLRGRHPWASRTDALWLGDRGRGPIATDSVYSMIKRRSRAAGVALHPHQLRHFFASQWLAEGGSEGGLMRAAGWSSRGMVDRYASATAAERSRAERRRLTLGDAV